MNAQMVNFFTMGNKSAGNQDPLENIRGNQKISQSPSILNEQGSIAFLGVVLTLACLCLSFFLLYKNFQTLNLVRERKENYLCLKSLLKEANQFTKLIATTNTIIAINFPLQFNPYTGPAHQSIIRATKIVQETESLHYRAKILGLKSCSTLNRVSFLKLQFFKSSSVGIGFQRSPIETTVPIAQENWLYIWNGRKQKGDILRITTSNKSALTALTYNVELKNLVSL